MWLSILNKCLISDGESLQKSVKIIICCPNFSVIFNIKSKEIKGYCADTIAINTWFVDAKKKVVYNMTVVKVSCGKSYAVLYVSVN